MPRTKTKTAAVRGKETTRGYPTAAVSEAGAHGIAVDSTSVYWTDLTQGNAGTLKKVPLSDGPITTLASGLDGAFKVAVDATSVYWTGGFTVMKLTPK